MRLRSLTLVQKAQSLLQPEGPPDTIPAPEAPVAPDNQRRSA
jgi:hypothetical protein